MVRRRNYGTTILLLAAVGRTLLAAGIAWSAPAPTDRRPGLSYPRAVQRRSPEGADVPRASLPRALRLEPPPAGVSNDDPAPRTTSPTPGRGRETGETAPRLGPEIEIRRRARAAAGWAVDALVVARGRHEYFRVGFYEGMSAALDDRRNRWPDRQQGERLGWEDRDARALGAGMGESAAAAAAEVRAEQQVVDQFTDLGTEPAFLPRADHPSYAPHLPDFPEPTLVEVLNEFPIVEIETSDPAVRHGLEGWSWDAPGLLGCDDYADFYDERWNDPAAAFDTWVERADLSVYYRQLDDRERRAFEDRFAEAFAARLAARFHTDLLPAFDTGLREGWTYGTFVRRELEFRSGYRAGFLDAVGDAALAAFHASYPEAYAGVYRAAFHEWSRNAKPAFDEIELLDANADGVFEPGEEVAVRYRLVNYGGGWGDLPLELDGAVLERSSRVTVELPPRSIVDAERPLQARIAGHVPARTDSRLVLALADVERSLPLRVSRPLQFVRGAWDVALENLAGEVLLEFELRNESRLPVDGTVELTTAARSGWTLTHAVGRLDALETRRLALAVDGLDSLDLLAGRISLEVALLGAGVRHDTLTCHLPDAARDLRNRDLLLYLVWLADDRPVSADRLATARELVLMRLREDWKVAAAGPGNPYKFDYRNGAATTALGDLVQTVRHQAPRARRHEVFAGLSSDVLELAQRLPGIHPFLRKYVRKLALELP